MAGEERGAGHPGDDPRDPRQGEATRRALRGALGRLALAIVFLIGALAHALGPTPHAGNTRTWMAALVVLSSIQMGMALRTFSQLRERGGRLWLPATLLWGALSAALLRLLLSR